MAILLSKQAYVGIAMYSLIELALILYMRAALPLYLARSTPTEREYLTRVVVLFRNSCANLSFSSSLRDISRS